MFSLSPPLSLSLSLSLSIYPSLSISFSLSHSKCLSLSVSLSFVCLSVCLSPSFSLPLPLSLSAYLPLVVLQNGSSYLILSYTRPNDSPSGSRTLQLKALYSTSPSIHLAIQCSILGFKQSDLAYPSFLPLVSPCSTLLSFLLPKQYGPYNCALNNNSMTLLSPMLRPWSAH